MDEVNKIRKAFFSKGESKHQIASRLNRSWATINRIVNDSREQLLDRGKRPNRKSYLLKDLVLNAIKSYLQEEIEKKVKRKQRYTAKFIYKELKNKGIYQGSLRRMQDLIKELRKEMGQCKAKSFSPLEFPILDDLLFYQNQFITPPTD